MPFFNTTVPEDFSGSQRLDKYISTVFTTMNRSKLKSGVTTILVNGKKAKLSTKVNAKDQIDIEWEDNVPTDIEPQDIPLDIVYEDENVTVVNKMQGMVTHPAAGNWDKTLVNALLFHWGRQSIPQENEGASSEILAARRPGIVHRLDKDTSGIIITAKNRETEEYLASQFKNHKSLSKIYICICKGHPPVKEGFIRTNIVRDAHDRKKFKAVEEGEAGKIALTKFKCIACYGPYSLIKVKIFTGRTHQIRVHLKFIGCPILGDPIYGNSKNPQGTNKTNNSKNQRTPVFQDETLMLHAFKLKIRLPGAKEKTTFTAKVPLRFKRVIKKLHETFTKSMPPDSLKTLRPSKGDEELFVFKAKKGYGQWQK